MRDIGVGICNGKALGEAELGQAHHAGARRDAAWAAFSLDPEI
jgi:hypothetical protein